MRTYRRINVASGRPLEKLAHYSRALHAGDLVLQSGTAELLVEVEAAALKGAHANIEWVGQDTVDPLGRGAA